MSSAGISAVVYHAGMSTKQNNLGVLMVATVAFGMGIDRSGITFI